MERTCRVCGFRGNESGFDKGKNVCRQCKNAQVRQYYDAHRQQVLNKGRAYYQKNFVVLLAKARVRRRTDEEYRDKVRVWKFFNKKGLRTRDMPTEIVAAVAALQELGKARKSLVVPATTPPLKQRKAKWYRDNKEKMLDIQRAYRDNNRYNENILEQIMARYRQGGN